MTWYWWTLRRFSSGGRAHHRAVDRRADPGAALRCYQPGKAVEAYQRIQEDGLLLLGTVLTGCDLSADRKRQYYYDYGNRAELRRRANK